MKKLTLIFFLLLPVLILQAQSRMELGLLAGISTYSGDLSPDEAGVFFEETGPAVGAFGRLNLGQRLALRLGVSYLQVAGDDANTTAHAERGITFRSNILEAALTAEVNLFQLGNSRSGLVTAPYLFVGGGYYNFRPETRFEGNWIELQPLGTEGQGLPEYPEPYQLQQFNVPVGLGLKLIFNDNFTLGFEFGARKLFTDYLDDVSGSVTVNYLDLYQRNPLAAQLSNPAITDPADVNYVRGGPGEDWYYIGGITLSYFLDTNGSRRRDGRNIGCPTF